MAYHQYEHFDVSRNENNESLSIRVLTTKNHDMDESSDEDDHRDNSSVISENEQEGAQDSSVIVSAAPTNNALEEFRKDVKIWMDLDNAIKKLKSMAKEKVKTQKELTSRIIAFMARYNIEDLNTRDGKLRYKVRRVKPPAPKQVVIKERLEACLKGNPDLCKHVIQRVFVEDAGTSALSANADTSHGGAVAPTKAPALIEKPCLKRLKGSRKSAMTVS